MAGLDLRPLTIGEILDRTFTLYRRHFLLFTGIMAVPQVLVLAINLAQTSILRGPGIHTPVLLAQHVLQTILVSAVVLVITFVAVLFAQAATILAVSDLYLGRTATLAGSLQRAWSGIGTVFVVGLLNSLAIVVGLILLIIPGFYILCRYIVAIPAALIEKLTPIDALSRSWNLTNRNAGRVLLLLLLYFAVSFAAGLLIGVPFGIAITMSKENAAALQLFTALAQVGSTVVNIVVGPILLIATCVFYFDLRVRKEAFDIQFLMDPNSERMTPPGTGSVPTILS